MTYILVVLHRSKDPSVTCKMSLANRTICVLTLFIIVQTCPLLVALLAWAAVIPLENTFLAFADGQVMLVRMSMLINFS